MLAWIDVSALPAPEKAVAVIVPAVKFPLPSRATIALAVFALVAVVALLLTFNAVEIVASFVSAIAAVAATWAFEIVPARRLPPSRLVRYRPFPASVPLVNVPPEIVPVSVAPAMVGVVSAALVLASVPA